MPTTLPTNPNLLTIKSEAINTTGSGDKTLVAAVAGKKLVVMEWGLIPDTDTVLTWKSGASTTIVGPLTVAARSGYGRPYSDKGLFATAAGEALTLNVSIAAAVGGSLTYVEAD